MKEARQPSAYPAETLESKMLSLLSLLLWSCEKVWAEQNVPWVSSWETVPRAEGSVRGFPPSVSAASRTSRVCWSPVMTHGAFLD